MGYSGGAAISLLPSRTATERACRRMAKDGGEFMLDRAQALTPVRTGATRAGWKQSRVIKRPAMLGTVYTTQVRNRHPNAERLEYGTAPHRISAKGGALLFHDASGRPIFRQSVQHPGTRAHHMLAQAAAETEAAFNVITRAALRGWAAEIEATP